MLLRDRHAPELPPDPGTDWYDWASCQGIPLNEFYPTTGKRANVAKQVCYGCPVAAQCLTFILRREAEHGVESSHRHGIWGGTTAKQRAQIHRCLTGICKHPDIDLCTRATRGVVE